MAKLTLNVDPDIIERGKRFARSKNQSLSSLVENYIKSMVSEKERSKNRKLPGAIKRLSGAIKLPDDYDYKKDIQEHWAKKYS